MSFTLFHLASVELLYPSAATIAQIGLNMYNLQAKEHLIRFCWINSRKYRSDGQFVLIHGSIAQLQSTIRAWCMSCCMSVTRLYRVNDHNNGSRRFHYRVAQFFRPNFVRYVTGEHFLREKMRKKWRLPTSPSGSPRYRHTRGVVNPVWPLHIVNTVRLTSYITLATI